MRRFLYLTERTIYWLAFALRALPAYVRHTGFFKAMARGGRMIVLYGVIEFRKDLEAVLALPDAGSPAKGPIDYIVVAPSYASNSAGIKSLYHFCHDLRERGYNAVVAGSTRGAPEYPVPLLQSSKVGKAVRSGAWVVYPETISGNPLKAKHVARWVLNKPGFLGGDKTYDKSELVYIYSDFYAAHVTDPIRGKLYLPMMDQSLFYPPEPGAQRGLVCFYVGKGKYRDGFLDPKHAYEITRSSPTRRELGTLFRASRLLYCFDNSTALAYEALFCGCPVIMVPDGTQNLSDFHNYELGAQGLCWGLPQEEPKPFDPSELRTKLELARAAYPKQVDDFVKTTQAIAPTRLTPPETRKRQPGVKPAASNRTGEAPWLNPL